MTGAAPAGEAALGSAPVGGARSATTGGLRRLLLIDCPAFTPAAEDDGGRRLRRFARMVESLASVCPWVDVVRPGVCTLPLKGPTRYFGSEEAVVELVGRTVAAALAETAGDGDATAGDVAGDGVRLGIAEGLFAAALAARVGVAVPAGETRLFLSSWPVDVLGDRELADVLVRLGLTTLGAFAELPVADVLARFGAAGARCHRVARGVEGELPGYRAPGLGRQLITLLGRELALVDHQPGFWGGTSEADERAAEALTVLQRRLGTEAVVVPVLRGGRGPAERCRLVPWRPAGAAAEELSEGSGTDRAETQVGGGARGSARGGRGQDRQRRDRPPWPGRLPPPAPAQVLAGACPAELRDERDVPVGVTGRGLLTARPARLSVAGGPWRPVEAWSAPWPVEEQWWSGGRRRAARLQVITTDAGADATAYLLVVERGRWRVEALYR